MATWREIGVEVLFVFSPRKRPGRFVEAPFFVFFFACQKVMKRFAMGFLMSFWAGSFLFDLFFLCSFPGFSVSAILAGIFMDFVRDLRLHEFST